VWADSLGSIQDELILHVSREWLMENSKGALTIDESQMAEQRRGLFFG